LTREIKKKSKECKDKWTEGKCQIVEDSVNNQNSPKLFIRINEQKTKTIVIGKKHEDINILLGNNTLEQVEDFVYFGSLISEDGKCEKNTRRRSSLAFSMVAKLNKIWKSSNISLRTKINLYKALVIPVFTYGSKCWTLNKCDERKMSGIEAAEKNLGSFKSSKTPK